MEGNLLLEQYSRYKKLYLSESPYKCLLNAKIELNPHQINAFCAAIQALKTGGIILADEVGLGKTIEAGLVLDYILDSGCKKILIVLPATLRKQWEIELQEKFGLTVTILDRLAVEKDYYTMKTWIEKDNAIRIILASYDYASKLIKRFPKVKWDFLIIDEAHNLRNVFHGTKRAKNLYELTTGIPKILLTATPLQNSLSDLHGLVSFIDPRIFGTEKSFNRHYSEGGDYQELKQKLAPVLYRTLRKDVAKYMSFKKRECITVDFALSQAEKELYDLVNGFLKRNILHSIPTGNKGLIILVIRKLLASSSFALIETFEILKNRLELLYQGTKSANAQEGFDLFWDYVEDEIDESAFDEKDDELSTIQKKEIEEELACVQQIIDVAKEISSNAKIEALKLAIKTAFEQQDQKNIPNKVVIFTESKRTQKYIAAELRNSGYKDEDIVLFNGDFNDAMTKEIYRTWQVKNFGNVNYGRSVEYKHAIVDYFKDNAKILIVTDAGSEGLNLQFCNTIINYDLPWNPQKIEQRIGRCHRYGQKHDVIAINLLNTDNDADRRVYEILSRKFELFEGVFGASDVALGALESGMSFEKTILEIYQSCNSESEFDKAFVSLNKRLDGELNKQASQLKSILLTENPNAKGVALDNTKKDIEDYLGEVEYWNQFAEPEVDGQLCYWQIEHWGEDNFASHGTLFIGAFCDNSRLLFPVLLLCDDNGKYIDFEEKDIIQALEKADDSDIRYYKPSQEEKDRYAEIYEQLRQAMLSRYKASIAPLIEYNKSKIDNWVQIQIEQLHVQMDEVRKDVEELIFEEILAIDSLKKKDIQKKIIEKKKILDKLEKGQAKKVKDIEMEAQAELEKFNNDLEINPILLVNIVLKF